MKEWELLQDLPIEKAGTRIILKDNDYVVKETGTPFPYSPLVNEMWFRVVEDQTDFNWLNDNLSKLQYYEAQSIIQNKIIEELKAEIKTEKEDQHTLYKFMEKMREELSERKYTIANIADAFNRGFESSPGSFQKAYQFEQLIKTLNKEK